MLYCCSSVVQASGKGLCFGCFSNSWKFLFLVNNGLVDGLTEEKGYMLLKRITFNIFNLILLKKRIMLFRLQDIVRDPEKRLNSLVHHHSLQNLQKRCHHHLKAIMTDSYPKMNYNMTPGQSLRHLLQ